MHEYEIKTDLDTVSEAWSLLRELGLDGLLLKKAAKVDPQELMTQLMVQGKLKRFISIVTGVSEADLKGLALAVVVQVITDFFTSLASDLQGLAGFLTPSLESGNAQSETTLNG